MIRGLECLKELGFLGIISSMNWDSDRGDLTWIDFNPTLEEPWIGI